MSIRYRLMIKTVKLAWMMNVMKENEKNRGAQAPLLLIVNMMSDIISERLMP